MNENDLVKLLSPRETEHRELKPSLSDSDRIVEVVASLANSGGGTVVIGISTHGKILGVTIGKQTIERLTNIITDNIDPVIYPDISVHNLEGRDIIVIEVKEGLNKPYLALGRPFKRVGNVTKHMKRDEYERLLLQRSKGEIQFDSQICEEASYDDIDEDKVKEFLEIRAVKLKVEIPRISIKDFLVRTTKAVKQIDGKLKPTHTAILFFGKNPQDFIPQSEIKVARFKGTTMIEFIDSKILKGSFYEVMEEVEVFFRRNTRLAGKIVEFKRVDIPEYPFEAIREAFVNAIAHRDYFRSGATVRVLIFDDRIEIDNPGGLLPGLDISQLEGIHETRNPLICDIFHQTKDMEKYGTGIGKMKMWMNEHGLQVPVFVQKGDFFQVTFYGPGDRILDLVPSIPEERTTDLSHLNKRQIKCLEMIYNEDKTLSRKQYAELLNTSIRSAQRDLRQLLDQGLIKEEGKARSLKYIKP